MLFRQQNKKGERRTMANQEFDNNKILSKEEQENFDRYMQEYENQNDLLVNAYNEDTKLGKISKNKPVMIGVACLLFIGCLIGIGMSFNKIDKQNTVESNPTTVAPPPVVAQAPTNEEQAMTFEERQAEEENKKELEQIKNSFNPFVGEQMSPDVNTYPTDMNPPVGVGDTHATQEIQPHEVATPPHETPNYHDYSQPPVHNPPNYNNIDHMRHQQEMQANGGEWMVVKGISVDRYGNKVVYIKNGNSTGTYSVGDKVNGYTVTEIGKTNVVVVDENGNEMYLNK